MTRLREHSYHYGVVAGDAVRVFYSIKVPKSFYGRALVGVPSDTIGVLEKHVTKGKVHKYLIDFGKFGKLWCSRCHFGRCTRKLGTLREQYCVSCNYRFYCYTQR
jgi:hypothetical protein